MVVVCHVGLPCSTGWTTQGRIHGYEGVHMLLATLPIRVMIALGAKTIILTNAAGGLGREQKLGSVMVISDHISMPSERGGARQRMCRL